jgi:Plasma-membrane choline transporter
LLWSVSRALHIGTPLLASWQQSFRRYFGGVTRGNTLLALKHSLTTSFGSLCFSSFVLTAVDMLRRMSSRRRTSIIGCIISVFMACCESIIQAITAFATVQMAATGEAFWQAACNVTALLSRNMLCTIRVWWMPSLVLNLSAVFFSAVYGYALGAMSYKAWQGRPHAAWVRSCPDRCWGWKCLSKAQHLCGTQASCR